MIRGLCGPGGNNKRGQCRISAKQQGTPMATELLKDSRDNVLGSIETGNDGGQVLRDANGKIRGYYDPTTDHTRGPDKRILAKGNALRTLIC